MKNKLFTFFAIIIIAYTVRGQGNNISTPVGVYGAAYYAATTIANGGSVLVSNGGVWGFGGNITSADKGNYNAPGATGRTETITFTGTGSYTGAAPNAGNAAGNFIDGYGSVVAPAAAFTLPLGSTGAAPNANTYAPLTIPATAATVTAAYFDGLAGTNSQAPGTPQANTFINHTYVQVLSPYFDINNSGSVSGVYTVGYPASFPPNQGSVLSGPDPVSGFTAAQYQSMANSIGSFSSPYSATGGTSTTSTAITVPSGRSSLLFASSVNALPVTLLTLTATAGNKNVVLNWSTAQETNNQGFEVERSTDNTSFSGLGFVNSKAGNGGGNSTMPLQYTYVDNMPLSGTNYYRLKQVDLSKSATYSKTVSASVAAGNSISIFPNPASSYIKVSGAAPGAQYKIISEAGQVIPVSVTGNNTINVTNLNAGIYFLQIVSNGTTNTIKVVKQ